MSVIILMLTIAFIANANKPISFEEGNVQLENYRSSLNKSCNTSNECVIANIGNCCGYYPTCLNKDAKPDADFVNRICNKASIAGMCGFPSIESCECIENRCENVPPKLNNVE